MYWRHEEEDLYIDVLDIQAWDIGLVGRLKLRLWFKRVVV